MKLDRSKVFCDILPPLTAEAARIEADRCYYCYDAPCIEACPTEIDIPSFIRKISNGNVRGAAMDILSANIMGGTCSRVCPVETLCQEACVREKSEKKPVVIGQLQRFATDQFFETGEQPFKRNRPNGKKVAVVGAGPAGLSCAHSLSRLGYEVVVYESKSKPGGLNEYGLAPYKVPENSVGREVDFILSLGGIKIEHNKTLGKDFLLEDLQKQYSAVFLGLGLAGVNSLGISGSELKGVFDAVRVISEIRQSKDLSEMSVAKHVVVIGGGNTAVDMAIQLKRLGAEFVTLVYRRGEEQMGATHHEQTLAQTNGVLIKTWAKPVKIIGNGGQVSEVEFEKTRLDASQKLGGTGEKFSLKAEQVYCAIGQKLDEQIVKWGKSVPEVKNNKIFIKENFETSIPRVFAGGDCVDLGEDLTVTSVQHGKKAAASIHQMLEGK